MAISNMQQPRQMYGLGSFVKKAFRGVKKIAKSPLGKMAIMAGLGSIPFGGFGAAAGSKASLFSRLGGAFAGGSKMPPFLTKGMGGTPSGGMFSKLPGFLKSMVPGTAGFSGKNLFMGLGATAVASPFISKMFTPEVEEEVVDEDYIDPYTARS